MVHKIFLQPHLCLEGKVLFVTYYGVIYCPTGLSDNISMNVILNACSYVPSVFARTVSFYEPTLILALNSNSNKIKDIL